MKKTRRQILGQHFLRDEKVSLRIVQTALEEAKKAGCATLLEIGPGGGALTHTLLEEVRDVKTVKEVVLSEADDRFVARWREDGRARVEEGSFLDLPEDRWLAKPPLVVVSNLPYSAGTPITTRLCRYPDRIPAMVLMFQAEVAQRLRAEPGTKDWGSLSIWVQNRWSVKRLIGVPPGAFRPPPKVNSEVVVLTPLASPRIAVSTPAQERTWEKLLKTAFAHRRKMLRSGLPSSGPWRSALAQAAIDDTKRAEALDWSEWERFFRALPAEQP